MREEFLQALDARRALALLGAEAADPATVARFRIRRRLGAGASATVYLAHDPALGRDIALKVLAPGLSGDARAVERFLAEARVIAGLRHPHVAAVHDAGLDEGGRVWIAMSYHEGGTLRARLEAGALPVAEALAIAREVAAALAAAHGAGIVHRDVKPENILLAGHGACLLDFGIAAMSGHQLTTASASLGTPSYMSPEQSRGAAVDARTDLWSLGVVLYEMLAGTRPFAAADASATIYGIRHDTPRPLRRLRPEVPAHVARLVARCLAKDPAARPATAAAFLEGLARPARRRWLLPAGVAAVACAVLGARLAAPPPPPPPAEPAALAILPVRWDAAEVPAYLGTGVDHLLRAALAREATAPVIAPGSIAIAAQGTADPREVARRVGAALALTSALASSGDSLVLALSLVRASDGRVLAAGHAASPERDVPALLAAARALVGAPLGLGPDTAARRPDPVAADLWLRGRYDAQAQYGWSLDRAAREFRDAARRDTAFAAPWLELAELEEVRGGAPARWYPAARAHLARALALAPGDPDALARASAFAAFLEHDWRAADSLSAHALAAGSNDVRRYVNRAVILLLQGANDEAARVMQRARRIDPLSSVARTHHAVALILGGCPAAGLAVIDSAMAVDSVWDRKLIVRGRALLALGRPAEAAADFRRSTAEYIGFEAGALLGHALGQMGRRAEAESLARSYAARAETGATSAGNVAVILLGLGDVAGALDWLARLPAEPGARFLAGDPIWAPVRDTPRFARLLAAMQLPADAGAAGGAVPCAPAAATGAPRT